MNQTKKNENLDMIGDICIPRMEKNIRREFIFNILRKLNIGLIERISEIPLKKESNTHKRVIIKVKWNSTDTSKTIQQRLQNNEPVNIAYEMSPTFWRLLLCNK
jgi:signal recognition particle subunit SEC65